MRKCRKVLISEAMKNIYRLISTLMIISMLAGCSQPERIVYESSELTISRAGAQIRIISHVDSREYTYALRRIKRAKNATVTERTILETDTVTITAAGGLWIVTVPERKVYIRW